MNDGFTKRGRASEESYFDRMEREKLEKLLAAKAQKDQGLKPAATGEAPVKEQRNERVTPSK